MRNEEESDMMKKKRQEGDNEKENDM